MVPNKNPPPPHVNPALEGFTVRTLDELLDHSYYRHRLEQQASELFWKRVFAWRASVSTALALMAGALTWFGFEVKTIGTDYFQRQASDIKQAADEQIETLKAAIAGLNQDRADVARRATELDAKTADLDRKIRTLEDNLQRTTSDSNALRESSSAAKEAVAQARTLADDAANIIKDGKKQMTTLEQQIAQFNRDAVLLRNIHRLNDEARSVRLFRMILLHSNDVQAFDFDVPIESSAQSRPVSVTFKTPKVKSDDFAEVSWEVREGGRAVSSIAATLFPGKEVAVDERGDLTLRVEAIRKQPFARSFLILTVRARAPEEPRPAAPTPLRTAAGQ